MERTMKNWFKRPTTPLVTQDSLRTYLLISILVLMVLAAIFGPLTVFTPPEDLW